MAYQYDLFQIPPTDLEVIIEENREFKIYVEKLRRSLFARLNEQMKFIVELQEEIDKLKPKKSLPVDFQHHKQINFIEN